MSTSDFRRITIGGDANKAEQMFRAAVTAFSSLTRPSRNEAAQLSDLTLSLYDLVSVDAKRYVASTLSDSPHAPAELVERLCEDRIDVAAPLLMRSPLLPDIKLLGLIGKFGLPHARAIARRANLTAAISQLIRAMEASTTNGLKVASETMPASETMDAASRAEQGNLLEDIRRQLFRTIAPAPSPEPAPSMQQADSARTMRAAPDSAPSRPAREEQAPRRPAPSGELLDTSAVRAQLLDAMRPATGRTVARPADCAVFIKLRDAAFTGDRTCLEGALGDALDMRPAVARTITAASGYSPMLTALRSLDLNEEQAYMLTSSVFPGLFAHAEAIRLFVERYRALATDAARDRVRGWKIESAANHVQWNSARNQSA